MVAAIKQEKTLSQDDSISRFGNNIITVLVPVRNEESNIEDCLISIVNQKYNANYEIIVIDGRSDDRTRNIVKRLQREHTTIKLLDNPSKIAPTALNIGLELAKGSIVIRVDGHAEIFPDYFQQCVEKLRMSGADCVGGHIVSVNKTKLGQAIALAMSSRFGVGNVRARTSGKPGFVDTVAFGAYKKEIFEKIGFFDEELVRCQDDEFNYRLRKAGGKIYFSPEIKSWYYPRSSLKKLWHQYFSYGFWKIRVLQKHAQVMQFRQFVPPTFVTVLMVGSISAIFSTLILYGVLIPIVTMYFLACVFIVIYLSWKNGTSYLFRLPLIFPILHFSYGLGFLAGLIKFASRWREERHTIFNNSVMPGQSHNV